MRCNGVMSRKIQPIETKSNRRKTNCEPIEKIEHKEFDEFPRILIGKPEFHFVFVGHAKTQNENENLPLNVTACVR